MKRNLLLTALTAGPLLALGQAPITLNQANFPVAGAATERTQAATLSTVAVPVRGANRTWDYSTLTPRAGTMPFTLPYAAATNPAFAGATRTYAAQLSFGAFTLVSNQYEGTTATGWYDYGFQVPFQRFSLGAITGSPNDSITFPNQSRPYPVASRQTLLPFPATYQRRFTNPDYRSVTDYRLKVAAFGLNNVPGQYVQRVTHQADSVVGWGTLRIPTAGGPSNPVRVLLVRHEFTEVDSIYLGGAPAPAPLLAAFGFTQGQSFRATRWEYYRENSSQPMLTIVQNPANGQVTGASYTLETNLRGRAQAGRLTALAVAPQPVAEALTIQAGGLQGEVLQAELRDLTGRRIAAAPLAVGLPTPLLRGLPGGVYLLQLRSARGEETTLRVVKE